MNIKDWEKDFDRTFNEPPDSDIGWIVRLNDVFSESVTNKTLKLKLKEFIKDLLSQSNQEILDRVDKEVLMKKYKKIKGVNHLVWGENQFIKEVNQDIDLQKQKLEQLKLSIQSK
jgi:hypothetical protein